MFLDRTLNCGAHKLNHSHSGMLSLHVYLPITHTWECCLPAGYLEMDTDLKVRKADTWAGLVLGWPSSMLTSQKLHKWV